MYQKAVADSVYGQNRCADYFRTVGAHASQNNAPPDYEHHFILHPPQKDAPTFLARPKGGEVTVDSEEDIRNS